jgi:hypothetical protein
MSTVTIELKRGKPVERLDFIAWKDDRRAFYARPHNGKPRVVTLTPALPGGADWTTEPFPECAPVKITPCYLLPPPCRKSKDEWKTVIPDEWEAVYLKTHGQGLHLSRDDDKALRERLAAHKKAARADYDRERKAAEQITDPKERARQIETLEHEYNAPLHTFHALECAGTLNMTLGMVKRGCEGIRNTFLVEWWAKRQRVDLAEMTRNRAEFRKWIEELAGRPAIIYDSRMKDRRRGLIPPNFHGKRDPRFMALCAAVRFRVEFQDGTAAYLTDCPPPRKELRAEERKELKREHGVETPHERRIRKGRQTGGEKSRKVTDKTEVAWIVKEIKTRLAKGIKRATAAKAVLRYYDERFCIDPQTKERVKPKPHYRTLLNYYDESTADMETGNR